MSLKTEKLILLNNIRRPAENKRFVRVGRGNASHGNKSGRGDNGQKSRPGGKNPKTEGGQFPTHLRFKKIGFHRDKNKYIICKTSDLNKIYAKNLNVNINLHDIEKHLKIKCTHTNKQKQNTNEANISLKHIYKIKILYDESVNKQLNVYAHAASKRALQYIRLININKEQLT